MANDMNKIKNHPGFMPFGCANVKSDTSDTQSEKDKVERDKDVKHDEGLGEKSTEGGEKGRA